MAEPEQELPPNPDIHYWKRVTTLGEDGQVVASQDIVAESGLLLVKQGMPLTRKLQSLLLAHRLQEPVDQCIALSETVSNHEMVRDAERELDTGPLLPHLQVPAEAREQLLAAIDRIPLTPALRTKLSIARQASAELYYHSVRVALTCVTLGYHRRLSEVELVNLATAGLLHDLGMLHIDPQLLDPGRVLSAQEKRFINAHPLIIHLMLKDSPVYHPAVSQPVLEHHERRGGNGYPKGREAFSSPLSGILALAEVLVSLSERQPLEQVLEALKLQQDQFDPASLAALFRARLSAPLAPAARGPVSEQEFQAQLALLAQIGKGWRVALPELRTQGDPLASHLLGWMDQLEHSLVRSGVDLRDTQALLQPALADNRQDFHYIIREALYQLGDLVATCVRRLEQNPDNPLARCNSLCQWLADSEQALTQHRKRKLTLSGTTPATGRDGETDQP